MPAEAETVVPPAGHESADVGGRFIGSAFGLLIASLAVVTLCVLWLFPMPSTDRTLRTPLPVFPAPRLQPSPREEMQRFLAEERAQLTSYGWVDKSHDIVRLPVDLAMKEIAQRGIADWPTPAGPSAKNSTPSATPSSATDAPR
jgi:hypothetical protein